MENSTVKNNSIPSQISDNCSFWQNDGQRCLELLDIFNSLLESSTVENILNSKPSPLISDELTYILEIIIVVVGLYITSLFGVCANVINTIIYGKQGLKDSITVGLFALSLSDLVLVTMPIITASCHVADYVLPESAIDFPSLHYVSSGWVRNMMYSMSCFITAFLSLERCCCIILPFKVKSIFTRGKTVFIIGLFFMFHLGCILMLPAAYELTWWPSHNFSVSHNMSRIFRVVFFEEGEAIEVFNTTLMSLAVPAVTQVIVTICVVVMIHGLRVSAKFRNTATTHRVKGQHNSNFQADSDTQFTDISTISTSGGNHDNGKTNATSVDNGKEKGQNNLSGRDARLIKTMVFLVSMQSACNVPFLAATFAWRSIPEMNIGMPYENTLRVVFSIVYLLGNLNASCNVFVYYHTSSAFRGVFNTMCHSRKGHEKP